MSAAFVQYVADQRFVMDYMRISAIFTFIYDYFLTLDQEINLVWFSRWSYTKFLFLVVRYTPFAVIVVAIRDQIEPNLSAVDCRRTYPVEIWLTLVSIAFAEAILAIRTWAVWNRKREVGILLAALLIGHFILVSILGNNFLQSLQFADPPYGGFRGCFITKSNNVLWGHYASLSVVEAIVLALMLISAYRTYRGGKISKFSLVVHRDGILFYIYLLIITVANVACIIALRPGLMILLAPLSHILYCVLTARIVFNIRDVSNRGLQTELHTGYDDPPHTTMPLQFVHDEEYTMDGSTIP